jgi:hypothetical protein
MMALTPPPSTAICSTGPSAFSPSSFFFFTSKNRSIDFDVGSDLTGDVPQHSNESSGLQDVGKNDI